MRVSFAINCVVAGVLLASVPAATLKCFRCSNNCEVEKGKPLECSESFDTCLNYNFPGLSERACWKKSKCDIKSIISKLNPHEWSRINATLGLTPANKEKLSAKHVSCCDEDLCNAAATSLVQPILTVLLPLALYSLWA